MIAAAKWMNNRYQELVSKVRFRDLRKVGELSLPAVVDNGTMSISQGFNDVIGSSTTFQTSIGSGSQPHYYFKVGAGSTWYQLNVVSSETGLSLVSNLAEDSVVGGSYKIVKRTHSLASDVRWLGSVVFPRIRRDLKRYSRDEFDISFPGRIIDSRYPEAFCEDGVDSSGYIQLEIYPPPKEAELLRYVYWSLPTDLTLSSTIPQKVDDYILKEGTLVDIYRKAKVAQIEKGNIDAASVYANEEAKQRTIWNRLIKDAIRTQRGVDDVTFIIESFGGRKRTGDISTAREHVYSNWSY